MIYNYSQTCFTNLASIIRAKTTLNKCMQHSCFTSMFHMFQSIVSVIIYMIRHVWLWCLMMHNMHDLQCLNACITPGCYSFITKLDRGSRGGGARGRSGHERAAGATPSASTGAASGTPAAGKGRGSRRLRARGAGTTRGARARGEGAGAARGGRRE